MSTLSVDIAGQVAKQGFVLLDHDVDGWTVALIAAGVAAVVYEVVMALTRMVTLRIPFLVLQVARLVTPASVRPALYKKWKGDLWDILRGKGTWGARFLKGMVFALQLALYGARSTAQVVRPDIASDTAAFVARMGIRMAVPFVACVTLTLSAASLFDLSSMARILVVAISAVLGLLVSVISELLYRRNGGWSGR